MDKLDAAEGVLTVINSNMANAIRSRTVQKGIDPREFALVAFGGAGPLHGAEVAAMLGIPEVIVPPYPGITSAMGLLTTDLKYDTIRTQFQVSGSVDLDRLNADIAAMERHLDGAIRRRSSRIRQHVVRARRRSALCRARATSCKVPFPRRRHRTSANSDRDLAALSTTRTSANTAISSRDNPIEIVNVRVMGVGAHAEDRQADSAPKAATLAKARAGPASACSASTASCEPSRPRSIAAQLLPVGEAFTGPAIVLQKDSTTVIPPGCTRDQRRRRQSHSQDRRGCVMNSSNRSNRRDQPATRVDPITGAVIQGALENIAIEMGHKLMRMSYSSIIRESEDFGAALTDAEGGQLCECKMSTPLQSGPIPGYIRGIRRRLRGPRRRVPPGRRDHAQRPLWRRLARPRRRVLRAGVRRRDG